MADGEDTHENLVIGHWHFLSSGTLLQSSNARSDTSTQESSLLSGCFQPRELQLACWGSSSFSPAKWQLEPLIRPFTQRASHVVLPFEAKVARP
jgi:hypothetical protein